MSLLDDLRTELSDGGQGLREGRRPWPASVPAAPTPDPVRPPVALQLRRLLVLVVVGALVIALASVGFPKVAHHLRKPDVDHAARPSTPPPTISPEKRAAIDPNTVAAEDDFKKQVAELAAFVEKTRGLTFKTPVTPKLLNNDAFLEKWAGESTDPAADDADIRREEKVLKALGLLSPDVDLVAMSHDTGSTDVFGWYDPATKELYVRGGNFTPLARLVLVHELTHALDDQYFNLERPELESSDTETQAGFRALVEGSARRVEDEYVKTLSSADRALVNREIGADKAGTNEYDFQPAMYFVAFPYEDGERFVDHLLELGGEGFLDAAFDHPPQSTAEVLEPERYLAGIHGGAIPAPAADGRIVDKGVLGELALFLILHEALPPELAGAGASTWEGDRYVAWEDGDRMCVRVRFLLEAPWLTQYTAHLLDEWASKQIDAEVEAPGTVLLTSCR